MKLTIKTESGQKVVDLNGDLQFKALKGEEYVFSNGFSNYVLNFKDNQESVVLTFNVNGKSIKVELNGIVPLLQANTSDMSNPTAIIINKDINSKDVDNIIDNTSFNGGEIIDQLESLMSKSIDLGDSKATNLTLITDYQTLLESLGAAAAGGDAGGNTSNGSTFNSTFSLTAGALNGIADSARGVNLIESISTTPIDSGNTPIAAATVPTTPITANIEVSDAGSVKEENGATLIYSVKLSNAVGTEVEVDLTTGGTATKGDDYNNTLQYSTDGGKTWLDVPDSGKVTLPADGSAVLVKVTVKDDAITENDETVTLTATTTNAQITTQTATGSGIITDDELNNDIFTAKEEGSEWVNNTLVTNSPKEGYDAAGNVLANDHVPANSLIITVIVSGISYLIAQDGSYTIITTEKGTLSINNKGDFIYDVNEKYNESLNSGDKSSDTFEYLLNNNTSTAYLIINIEGTNDAPVINGVASNDPVDHSSGTCLFGNCDLGVAPTVTVENGENLNTSVYNYSNNNITLNINDMNAGIIYTKAGADTVNIQSDAIAKVISLGEGDDSLSIGGNAKGSTINLGNGNNNLKVVKGTVGATILTGDGKDTIVVGGDITGATISTKKGDDTLIVHGNASGATIHMDEGNDTLKIGGNADNSGATIYMGDGDDTVCIAGNAKGVTLHTENGNDIVNIGGNASGATITTGNGNDIVRIVGDVSGSGATIDTGADNDAVYIGGNADGATIHTRDGNDILKILGNANAATLYTEEGDDKLILKGNATAATIHMGAGNDVLRIDGNVKGATIGMEQGNDTLIIGGDIKGATINLGSGDDAIYLNSQWDNSGIIHGSTGFDTLYLSGDISGYAVYKLGIRISDFSQLSGTYKIYKVDVSGNIVGEPITIDGIEKVVFSTIAPVVDVEITDDAISNTDTTGSISNNGIHLLKEINISDVDDANLESANIVLTNYKVGDVIDVSNLPSGITATTNVVNGKLVVTLTGSATVKTYEDAIKSLTFKSTNDDKTTREIEITVNDGDKNSNVISFSLDLGGSTINTSEDISKVVNIDDFGTYSGDISKVKIESLPTNGVFLLSGIEVVSGQEISVNDIKLGKLVFNPTENTDLDSSFSFKVSSGISWSEATYSSKINITAVADKPTASINIEKSVTIDTSNVTDSSNGYTVTAYNTSGTETTISTVNGTSHDGFGVSGASSGASTEIGYNNTAKSSEQLKVAFINDVSSVNVTFAWKHAGTNPETAVIEFYRDGVLVGTQTHTGGTDTVDGPFTFKADNGAAFDEVRFSALGIEDDYLIHEISFTEVQTNSSGEIIGEIYNVDISAALTDTDGSESLTVTITNVPKGATLSSDSYTLVDNGNNTWSVTIPAGTKSINDSIKMTVPESQVDDIHLGITARATETNDNSNGLNYSETISTDTLVFGINETNTLVFGKVTTNLLLTLDVSGSMSFEIDNSSETRLDIAKKSLIDTIKAYEANGQTEVNLTLFKVDSINIGWMSSSEAISYINSLQINSETWEVTANGVNINLIDGTGYNDALTETMKVDFTGHNATQTIAYFISDGEANAAADKIDQDSDTTIKNWKNYVDKNIDTLNVIGISKDISAKYLKIIQVQDGDNVILVQKEETLGDVLSGTVHSSITGGVLDNIIGGDGNTKIDSIVIDGKEYTKDNFPTDGVALDGDGKLTFNFDTGKYEYSVKSSEFSADTTKTFEVNASDEDGDKTKFDVNLKIDISPNESVHTLNISGEDIDLSAIISSNTNTDVINLENSKVDKISVDLNDVLLQEDHQLIIKGDLGDKVDLDTPSDWSNIGKEQLDGVNYNVYTGTGANSTVKLLIDDDIDVTPDI